MRTGPRVLLGLTAAAALILGVPATATADPSVWRWGPIHSTDGHAVAGGKVAAGQSGLVVYGTLEDTRGSGCSWVHLRSMSARDGRWRTASFYNCVPGTGRFRRNVGGVLQIKAKVCRGTSSRPTGWCSRWKTVYTQGG